MTLKEEIVKAVNDYNCLGSWWTYEPEKMPADIIRGLCGRYNVNEKEVHKIAYEYSGDVYSECKPDLNDPRQAKDWGCR